MPSLDWNKTIWDVTFNWQKCGEEWSKSWGGSAAQWVGTILPRINQFLPCNNILEIAPGFGRWTRFLLASCDKYVGIDLSRSCIDYCAHLFDKGVFQVNDGYSLAAAPDGEFDFIFSFDSLVHAERDVVESYLSQIPSKLNDGGVAFLHLSNFQALPAGSPNADKRAENVSADTVRNFLTQNNIPLLVQETIGFEGGMLLDQLVLVAKKAPPKPAVLLENPQFMQEAAAAKNIFQHYCRDFMLEEGPESVRGLAAGLNRLWQRSLDKPRGVDHLKGIMKIIREKI